MAAISPRNPNVCISCEQLLEDDCAELDALLASAAAPKRLVRPVSSPREASVFKEPNEIFSSPFWDRE
jgi:hypothetical protein